VDYNELDIVDMVIKRAVGRVRTAIPGKVLAYDAATQTATVQPSVRVWRVDEEEELTATLPTSVSNCPVLFPAGGGVSITWPLVEGDVVTLLVADRSIDEWMATAGSDVEPRSVRRFAAADTLVLPGLRPSKDPLASASTDGLQIATDGAQLRMKDAGTFAVENTTGELVALLVDLIDALLHTPLVVTGAAAAIAPLALVPLDALLTKLTSFQE
jgi:hypothetical protein